MLLLSAGFDIHDRINALNGDNTQDVGLWDILSWTVVGLLIIVVAYFVTRNLFRDGEETKGTNRRGANRNGKSLAESFQDDRFLNAKAVLDDDHAVARFEPDDVVLPLNEIGPQTRVALFWNVGELRCGCLGKVVEPDERNLLIEFDSESAPRKGRALLVAPETEGHTSFYEINVVDAPTSKGRVLGTATVRSASRMNRRFRAHVAVPAAVLKKNEVGENEPTMIARVHDMAFDGLGVLSEEPMAEGDELILRLQFPGYLEPLTLEGDVTWSQKDIAGIFRAGIRLSFDAIETRLHLADYMFGRLKAESSALVLEQRRRQNTPIKPTKIQVPD